MRIFDIIKKLFSKKVEEKTEVWMLFANGLTASTEEVLWLLKNYSTYTIDEFKDIRADYIGTLVEKHREDYLKYKIL